MKSTAPWKSPSDPSPTEADASSEPPVSEEDAWLVSPSFAFPRPPRVPSFDRSPPRRHATTFLASFGLDDDW